VKNTARMGLVALAAGTWIGCAPQVADPGDIPSDMPTGTLLVELGSEQPTAVDPRVEEVWVRIDSVEARHEDLGWISVTEMRQDVDLLAADKAVIGDADIWVGSYNRLEIGIADTWIVVDGTERELSFIGDVDLLGPLAGDALLGGIILTDTFFVDEDSTTTVDVDWDIDENLSPQGDGWMLGASTSANVDIAPTQ
jgi:hypothetical protein